MEHYEEVYAQIREKAIRQKYGYTEDQVRAIYVSAFERALGPQYANIPYEEKRWMVERWTWEILFPLEKFPGEKPGWRGGNARYFEYLQVDETDSSAEMETPESLSDDPSIIEEYPFLLELRQFVMSHSASKLEAKQNPQMQEIHTGAKTITNSSSVARFSTPSTKLKTKRNELKRSHTDFTEETTLINTTGIKVEAPDTQNNSRLLGQPAVKRRALDADGDEDEDELPYEYGMRGWPHRQVGD